MNYKVFESSNNNVSKFVFTGNDFVAESILYKYGSYEKRTVICCSTQSGCKVGCKFCGTGNRFIRNLTKDEIVNQIKIVLKEKGIENIDLTCDKFQIMFMSMGEPMHNWDNVELAIVELHDLYPNAQLLISTIGVDDDATINKIIALSKKIDALGLQFSIHKSNDADRNKLIPFEGKLALKKIRDFGLIWWRETNRKPYLNYCIDGVNNTEFDVLNLQQLFSPVVFNFTFSVVCSANETMKDAGFKNLNAIKQFQSEFISNGYNTRIFNPEGQDDIGGGCGQLWYVQDWIKNHNAEATP